MISNFHDFHNSNSHENANSHEIAFFNLEHILNAILVMEDIRPAMLIQPADYGEATHNDPKTKSAVEMIQTQFPTLKRSDVYKIYQGVIFSKINYNHCKKYISLQTMGKLLGYPCYKNFDAKPNEKVLYSISINVTFKDSLLNSVQLFANQCKSKTSIPKFKQIAEKAKLVFQKEQYKCFFSSANKNIEIDDVFVEVTKNVPTQCIIQRIIQNKTLTPDDIQKIQNILFNFGFNEDIGIQILNNFEYKNPIHRGILLDTLLKEKHDILSPFYPLQFYPKQEKQIDEITKKWEADLLDILSKTKVFPLKKIK